ncbi:MAG: hypothetical protein ABI072_03375 [Edaphobacter sp.]
MSNSEILLAQTLLQLSGRCRVCGCGGDECSLRAGEKCCWIDDLRTLCSNPRCIMTAEIQRKRDRRMKEQREARAAALPAWVVQRRKANAAARKRNKKTKGRAA